MMSRAFALIKIVSIIILNNTLCDESNVDLLSEREVEQMFKLALDHTCKKRVMLRRRLFWPKKNCRKKCVNRDKMLIATKVRKS